MRNLFIILCVITTYLSSEIIESSTIADMNKYNSEGVIFLYDIDNTLVRLNQTMGCDQWFQHHLKETLKKYDDKQKGLDRAFADWTAVQHISKPIAPEKEAYKYIKELQDTGAMMIGFTTRGIALSRVTPMQLEELGIDFTSSSPVECDFFFINKQSIIFRNGVLFTAATHKGTTLFEFLGKLNVAPKKVVFINDKWDNLRQVEETCEELGVPFVGLRYNVCDEWVKTFNSEATDIQFERFKDILSDEEAKNHLK